MAGSLFDTMNEARDVFIDVVMIDPAEMHRLMAAWTDDAVAMHDATNTFAECGAAFRTANADFHVVDGIAHGTDPGTDPGTGPAQPVHDEQA
jgi:hypothetical protein